MEQKPKRPGKRDYLNDFSRDLSGSYHYTGKVYHYRGEAPLRPAMLALCGLAAFLLLAQTLCCWIPAAGMDNTFYVILPAALGLVGAVSVAWAMVRLQKGGEQLRAYVYRETVEALPMRSGAVTLCSAAALLGEAAFLLLHGFGGRLWASLLFLALQGAALWASILFRRRLGALRWE